MYRGARRSIRRRAVRRRVPYVKRSMFQTGNLVARTMGRSSRMRSNMKKRGVSRGGSSVVMQYAKSILNPSIVGGKIPDDFVQPSAPFQLEKEFIVDGGAAGTALLMAFELGTMPSFGWHSPAEATNLLPASLSSMTGNLQFLGTKADLATLLSLYKTCRLVSAGIKVQYVGTDSNNQGVITVAYLNRAFFSQGEELAKSQNAATASTTVTATATDVAGAVTVVPNAFTYITASATQNNYFGLTATSTVGDLGTHIRTLPVNAYGAAKDGAIARYFPLDGNDIEFRQLQKIKEGDLVASGNGWLYAQSNQYIYGTTETNIGTNYASNNMDYGAFIITCESIQAKASYVVKCTCNYEGQIRDEALNLVSTKPSPVAPGAMAKASKIYGRSWQCKVGGDMNSSSY